MREINLMSETIYDMALEVHAENVSAGWWDDPNRDLDLVIMLILSELSEALEGERKNLNDDKLPHLPMFSVELADAVIRALDLLGYYLISNPKPDWKPQNIRLNPPSLSVNYRSSSLLGPIKMLLSDSEGMLPIDKVYNFIMLLIGLSNQWDIPLFSVIEQKRAFNRIRLDHKRETRQSDPNGKKF
jgi:hypothetical protein